MSKEYYRKDKIDKAASHDRRIECLKRQVESAKEREIKSLHKPKNKNKQLWQILRLTAV